jgi:hypothetical protein
VKDRKKAKLKTNDHLTLVKSGFLHKKEMDLWRTATGDPYPMEKNLDEIPMFARFVERGLTLPASDFSRGCFGTTGSSTSTSTTTISSMSPSRAFLRGVHGDQAQLDCIPKVLPVEVAAEHG